MLGEGFRGAFTDLGGGTRHDPPGPRPGLGELTACGPDPGGQVRIELGQAFGRCTDDRGAGHVDGGRALHRTLLLLGGVRGAGARDGLVASPPRSARSTPAARMRASRRWTRSGRSTSAYATAGGRPGWISLVLNRRQSDLAERVAAPATHCVAPGHGHPATSRVVGHRTRMARTPVDRFSAQLCRDLAGVISKLVLRFSSDRAAKVDRHGSSVGAISGSAEHVQVRQSNTGLRT